MDRTPRSVGRQDVEQWWQGCIDGHRPRSEASAWAESRLDESDDMEELVLQGVLELQSLWRRSGDEETIRAGMVTGLRRWQAELHSYDDDPETWDRRHFQRILVRFRERHSVDRIRSLGRKMVSAGLLSDRDVEDALEAGTGGGRGCAVAD